MKINLKQAALTLWAFTGIYGLWGSTYLAIRFTIETMPPLLTAGVRFLVAGCILFLCARIQQRSIRMTLADWRSAFVIGGLLLLGANGNVVLAEQSVPSSVAALAMAVIPAMTVVLDWCLMRKPFPSRLSWIGIGLGFLGVAILLAPDLFSSGSHSMSLGGVIHLILAAVAWSLGTLMARQPPVAQAPILSIGMQLIAGGCLLFGAGIMRGELSSVHMDHISLKSCGALVYLIIFGSLWGYSAYVWVLKHGGALQASSCAFVNPLVAVVLGAWLGHETLGPQVLMAACLVITAVGIIVFEQARKSTANAEALEKRVDKP